MKKEDLGLARVIRSYDQIIGHRSKVEWIKSAVQKDNVPDVMIFHGNPGLGKSSLAKLLAIDVTTRQENRSEEHTSELRH